MKWKLLWTEFAPLPPNPCVEALSIWMDLDIGPLPKLRRMNEVISVGSCPQSGSALIRRDTRELALSLHAMWKHREKLAIYKAGLGPPSEHNHTGTVTLGFQPPELWEKINLCSWSYPIYGIFLLQVDLTKTGTSTPSSVTYHDNWRLFIHSTTIRECLLRCMGPCERCRRFKDSCDLFPMPKEGMLLMKALKTINAWNELEHESS